MHTFGIVIRSIIRLLKTGIYIMNIIIYQHTQLHLMYLAETIYYHVENENDNLR